MENELLGTVNLTLLEADSVVLNGNEEATIGEETPLTYLQSSIPEGATVKIYLDFDNFFLVIYPVVYLGSDEYQINYRSTRKDRSTSIDPRMLQVEFFISSLIGFLQDNNIRQSKYFPTLLTIPTVYTNDVLDFLNVSESISFEGTPLLDVSESISFEGTPLLNVSESISFEGTPLLANLI